jgi:hypothetical protein
VFDNLQALTNLEEHYLKQRKKCDVIKVDEVLRMRASSVSFSTVAAVFFDLLEAEWNRR